MRRFFIAIKQFFTLRFKKGEKLDLVYPISWETMSQEDFRNVCMILTKPHGRKEALFLCLCALAHIRPDNPIKYDQKAIKDNLVFLIGDKSYVITPKVIQESCHQLEYIFDEVGLAPCPLMKVDRKIFGLSFEQFYSADSYMLQYAADNNNEKWLKEAAKVLTNGATRKLLDWQKKGLVIWWNGVKKYMMQKYPYVLHEGESITDRTQTDILYDLLSVMNDNKPQDNDRILKSDVHSVLFTLNQIYERNAHN